MTSSNNGLAFAKKYFGSEWDAYLLEKGFVTSPSNTTFHDTIAAAFDLLNDTNQQKLIYYITNTRFSDGKNHFVRFLLNIVLKKEYRLFYDKIYSYLDKGKYTYNDFCLAFLEIIEVDKRNNLKEEIKTDESIIDVTGEDQKIDYKSEPKIDNSRSSNIANVNVYDLPHLYDEIRLGTKYKDKLNLGTEEVAWLNKFWNPNNVFLSIEGCCLATIRLYIVVMKEIEKVLKDNKSSLNDVVDSLFVLTSNEYGYYRHSDWANTYNNYYKERSEVDVYWAIFKKTENAVRNAYNHKRKLEDSFSSNAAILEKFNELVGSSVDRIVDANRDLISPPSRDTLIELNFQNVTRWKFEFEDIEKTLSKENLKDSIIRIYELTELNIKNPGLENIYFEASKIFAKLDRLESIKLYLHYLSSDLKSNKIDNKQLTKTIQKSLFKNNEELQEFEKLVSELLKDRDIERAIGSAARIYEKKRKKIQVDASIIKEVKERHTETVELLNEVLEEEYEDDDNKIKMVESGVAEMKIEILSKSKEKSPNSDFLKTIGFTPYQELLVKLFKENNLTLSFGRLDSFVKTNGLFKNQLIDSINEKCFEILDDVLIEEDELCYIISMEYFDKIKNYD